jgi:spectinomycin phosphotransferase
MLDFKSVLQEQYNVKPSHITAQKGGWASLAYRVETAAEPYFLKVYEKSRASTPKWTSLIKDYIPIVLWLNANTNLRHKIIKPIPTINGRYSCEDEYNIYILFDYIEGEIMEGQYIDENTMVQLAHIISELHKYDEGLPLPTSRIREDYSLPFCDLLNKFISKEYINCSTDLKATLEPFIENIKAILIRVQLLANELIDMEQKYVLCHTDIHNGNIIRNDHIVLIDWEGLKLAPPEADLFMLIDRPYWKSFVSVYKEVHRDFEINNAVMEFYRLRRKAEDLWEWIEQLQYDSLEAAARKQTLESLKRECLTI